MYNQMVARISDDGLNQVLRALADTTRRDILRRTVEGKVSVSDLAERYDMSFAAVQKHVAVLERAGLVTKRPSGKRRVVSTNAAALANARRLLDHYEELWRGRIDRMTDLIEETKESSQ
jgi:DNA-binding transcriptional ArsR family regulator